MSEFTPTDSQLARYLTDELSAGERVQIDTWLLADPAHREELARLQALTDRRGGKRTWNLDRAWSQVDAQLAAPGKELRFAPRGGVDEFARDGGQDTSPHGASRQRPQRPRAWWGNGLRAAAALVLVAGAGYLWRARSIPATQESDGARFATAVGEARDLMLDDSTMVTLGPASTLRVAADYGRAERAVDLIGEAWFRVRHDDARPFSVRAAGTITLDIGTEFTVRALEGDSVVRVTVLEGAATLRRASASPSRAALLRAHEVGELVATRDEVRTTTDSSATASWRTGTLTFEQATLDAIVADLRRWYRGPFEVVTAAAGSRRVSATLPTSDLPEALEILRLALGITIEQAGDTVRIR